MANDPKYKISPGMRLFWCGLISSVSAFCSVFLAFCSPYWYQSWRRVHSPLANVGLWHICLSGYVKPKDPQMQSYVGCWWIHSSFFKDVQNFIMPPWFRACQALVIFTLICNICSLVLCVTYVVEKWRRKIYGDRYVLIHIINSVLLFAAAFLVFIVSLVFAEMARQEDYFPRPWMNYLSWSYGFNVLSGFFSAFGGICLFIMAMILKEKLFASDGVAKEFGQNQGSESVITGVGAVSEKSKSESFVQETMLCKFSDLYFIVILNQATDSLLILSRFQKPLIRKDLNSHISKVSFLKTNLPIFRTCCFMLVPQLRTKKKKEKRFKHFFLNLHKFICFSLTEQFKWFKKCT